MGLEVGGIFGLLVLAISIYAIVKILQSGAGTGGKVLWILIILLLPIIGLIAWFLFGPKG